MRYVWGSLYVPSRTPTVCNYDQARDTSDISSRVIGAKIQVAGWTTSACLLWTLKLCMTFFYLRLTVRPRIISSFNHLLLLMLEHRMVWSDITYAFTLQWALSAPLSLSLWWQSFSRVDPSTTTGRSVLTPATSVKQLSQSQFFGSSSSQTSLPTSFCSWSLFPCCGNQAYGHWRRSQRR